MVLHAAPLVQLASGSGGPRLEPVALTLALALTLTLTLTLSLNPNLNPNPNQVAHSKRSGLRAWQGLLQELRGLGVAARVRLDVATLDTLQHALSQVDNLTLSLALTITLSIPLSLALTRPGRQAAAALPPRARVPDEWPHPRGHHGRAPPTYAHPSPQPEPVP